MLLVITSEEYITGNDYKMGYNVMPRILYVCPSHPVAKN